VGVGRGLVVVGARPNQVRPEGQQDLYRACVCARACVSDVCARACAVAWSL